MLQQLLTRMNQGLQATGTLRLRLPAGREHRIGDGPPEVALRFASPAALARVLLDPELAMGEAYVRGDWEVEEGALVEALEVGLRIAAGLRQRRGRAARALARLRGRLGEFNDARLARRNIARHYDIGTEVYRRFLDAEMHYSCAYFAEPRMTLEAAQQAKCALIARKLDLRPGVRVLDIGCGFGGMALYLARHCDAQVTGITLSKDQLAVAQQRAAAEGLSRCVDFRLQDYRSVEDRFDAIVSVGMFEHVGRPQYATFFDHLHELLADDGVALLHSIGRSGPPGVTNPWIRRHIFPGGYIPSASEVLPAIERSGLLLTDLEIWRLHYASTLAEWHRRFCAAEAAIAQTMGERFCRMWRFYLQASEASFRTGGFVVFQLQMARQLKRLPLTRDYLYESRPAEAAQRPRVAS